MKINGYEIIPIETGRFALDGGAMFGVIPKNLWQRTNPADEQNRIELALRCLLLKGKDKTILIDTGVGEKLHKKLKNIYKVDHSQTTLEKTLSENGVKNEDITDVIISHLHFDHTGGTTKITNGEIELTFPNAMHHVQLEQWDWANSPAEKDRASFITDNFLLMEQQSKLNILNGSGKITDGIEVMVLYGHTPGMQMIKISDSKNTLLYCADLFPTASHIPVPWVMAYDNNPLITIEEKKRLLPKVLEENWILFFEHDPFRAAGTVELNDRGYSLKEEIKF
jgi:glyoxylase-like metal-dependent hydrolase (beta-lactamase superfamily II)